MNKQEKAALLEWVELHRCCAICWWPESDGRRKLDVHHIIGGRGRKNDVRNYVRLCHRDHDILHSGRVAGNVSCNSARVKDVMIAMTKANVIPHIVLSTTAADDVMNVQLPAAI